MWNVKTLADDEAVSNENEGYMKRRVVTNSTFVCVVGDKVESWSTNTLDTGYTKTN